MALDPVSLSWTASWIATGLGVALWLWSWLGEKNAIQKLRYRDCGVVLVFSGVLMRVLVPARDYKNRHASIMLALDATLDALAAARSSATA
jgi:hypothetical protein